MLQQFKQKMILESKFCYIFFQNIYLHVETNFEKSVLIFAQIPQKVMLLINKYESYNFV